MPPLRELNANSKLRRTPYELSKPPQRDIDTAIATLSAFIRPLQPCQPLAKAPTQATAELSSASMTPELPIPVIYYCDDSDSLDFHFKWNCNQIRNKINNLIRSGEMKVTHFQKELGINSNSYGRFMKLKGPMGGCDNQTYSAAHSFFLKRERAGVKKPKARKETTAALDRFDFDGIVLDGELEGEVPVYDTCDDIRRKIQAHLREPGVTQTGFLREIVKTYKYTEPTKKIQSIQLKNFLGQKGARSGNMSAVYYGAYVFFEKMRLKTGAAKSKKRLEVEEIHWAGMDRKTNFANQHYICSANKTPVMDDFGCVFTI